MDNKAGISIIIGIVVIVIANILATEYRIYREKQEHKKLISSTDYHCPACPKCK